MRTNRGLTTAVLMAALSASLLASCGGDDDEAQGSSTDGIKVAYASALDPNDVADQIGLELAGADVQALSDDAAAVAGLLRGSVDVANVDFDAAIKAAVTGVPIKIIYISQTKPEYVFVARPEVKSPDDLAGKVVGFHSEGGQTDIFVRAFLEQSAPEAFDDVEFVALEESSRRAQAMVAKRMDASALEAINLAELRQEGGYQEFGSWADLEGNAAEVLGTAWITTEETYAKQKERLQAFVADLQEGYEIFYDDKRRWLELAQQKLPDVDQSLLPDVYESYKEQQMYPRAGEPAVTPEIFEVNDEFFRDLGEWEDPQSDEVVAYDLVESGAKSQQ